MSLFRGATKFCRKGEVLISDITDWLRNTWYSMKDHRNTDTSTFGHGEGNKHYPMVCRNRININDTYRKNIEQNIIYQKNFVMKLESGFLAVLSTSGEGTNKN